MSPLDPARRFIAWATELGAAYRDLLLGRYPYGDEDPLSSFHPAEPSDDHGYCAICRHPIYSLIHAGSPRTWHHK